MKTEKDRGSERERFRYIGLEKKRKLREQRKNVVDMQNVKKRKEIVTKNKIYKISLIISNNIIFIFGLS